MKKFLAPVALLGAIWAWQPAEAANVALGSLSTAGAISATDTLPFCQTNDACGTLVEGSMSQMDTFLLSTSGLAGTSGAKFGLLNGTLTFAGNDTFTGVPLFTGLSSGTCVSALAIDSGNNLVKVSCGGGSGLTVGTTSITSGTSTKVLYDNAGVLGEYTVTGSGNVVLSTSPSIAGGALSGTFSGTPTLSGNFTMSGVPLLTGLSSGTCSSGLGIDASNNAIKVSCPGAATLTINSSAIAGGAAGHVLYDDGTKLQELAYGETGNSTIVETTSGGLLDPTILPLGTNAAKGAVEGDGQTVTCVTGTCSTVQPDATKTSDYTITAGEMGGIVVYNGSNITATIPAISSTVLATGMSVSILNINATPLTISTTPTINGFAPTKLAQYEWLSCVSNNTSLDCISNHSLPTTATLTISTATFTPDFTAGVNQQATLVNAACPCTIANPSNISTHVGQTGMLDIIQSSTGSDTVGTWGSQYVTPGGTSTLTLSTGANAIDHIAYRVIDSTHVLLSPVMLNATH